MAPPAKRSQICQREARPVQTRGSTSGRRAVDIRLTVNLHVATHRPHALLVGSKKAWTAMLGVSQRVGAAGRMKHIQCRSERWATTAIRPRLLNATFDGVHLQAVIGHEPNVSAVLCSYRNVELTVSSGQQPARKRGFLSRIFGSCSKAREPSRQADPGRGRQPRRDVPSSHGLFYDRAGQVPSSGQAEYKMRGALR